MLSTLPSAAWPDLEFLRFGPDPLRNAGVALSLLVLAGGLVCLGLRIAAACRGREPTRSLVVLRMVAVLGALGGFVVHLRDAPGDATLQGLTLGGLAASPWILVLLLELVRRLAARIRGGRDTPDSDPA